MCCSGSHSTGMMTRLLCPSDLSKNRAFSQFDSQVECSRGTASMREKTVHKPAANGVRERVNGRNADRHGDPNRDHGGGAACLELRGNEVGQQHLHADGWGKGDPDADRRAQRDVFRGPASGEKRAQPTTPAQLQCGPAMRRPVGELLSSGLSGIILLSISAANIRKQPSLVHVFRMYSRPRTSSPTGYRNQPLLPARHERPAYTSFRAGV